MLSADAAKKTLHQPTEMPRKVQLFEKGVSSFILRVSKTAKACKNAAGLVEEQDRQTRTLEACIGLLKEELDLSKLKKLTGCDNKVT